MKLKTITLNGAGSGDWKASQEGWSAVDGDDNMMLRPLLLPPFTHHPPLTHYTPNQGTKNTNQSTILYLNAS